MVKSQAAVVAALFLGSFAIAPQGSAQTVPLPAPAPHPKASPAARTAQQAQPAKPPAPVAQPAQQPQPAASGPKFSLPSLGSLFGAKEAPALDAKQQQLVGRVSAYLSSVRLMSGDFVQVGPDGRKTEGQFYIQKPGRVRFEYQAPSPIELIADGQSVVVRDRKLATQDLYPLSQTPLRFLVADQIDLLRDTTVVGVTSDDVFNTVIIEEKQVIGGTHRLMLMFGAKDLQLRQWTVTDPQGYDTTVAIYNVDSKKTPKPELFVINYERPLQ
jgi:outer membrane lipoprotein-sorting protein